jgi:hypothetical protein
MTLRSENETYLGDGVYASFDGFQIWLDTRAQLPVNRIALEQPVYEALLDFVRNRGLYDCTSETGEKHGG